MDVLSIQESDRSKLLQTKMGTNNTTTSQKRPQWNIDIYLFLAHIMVEQYTYNIDSTINLVSACITYT